MGTGGASGERATGRSRRERPPTPGPPGPPGPLRCRHVRGQDGTRCRRAVAVEERPERALRVGERPPGRLLHRRAGRGAALRAFPGPSGIVPRLPLPLLVRDGSSAARDRVLPPGLWHRAGPGQRGLGPVRVLLIWPLRANWQRSTRAAAAPRFESSWCCAGTVCAARSLLWSSLPSYLVPSCPFRALEHCLNLTASRASLPPVTLWEGHKHITNTWAGTEVPRV